MVADALSCITTCLGPEAMQSILDGVTLGTEGLEFSVVEGDHNVEKEVHVAVGQVKVEMHVTNWAAAQKEDPVLSVMLNWLGAKKNDLRTLLGEHASSKEGWVLCVTISLLLCSNMFPL